MQKVKAYECPICMEQYATKVRTVPAFACEICGKQFHSCRAASFHEATCTDFAMCHEPTCMQCAHWDKEGFYHRPCRQYHHAPPVPACAHFEPVTK